MPPADTHAHPGERLGLPASGSGSVARFGRRLAALAIDVVSAAVIGYAFFHHVDAVTGMTVADPIAANLIFAAVQLVFLPTLGGSPGHRLLGLRLVRTDGSWVGLWRPVVRTALLFLVVPAVIWDADQRGLHDKAAGTVLIRA